MCVNCISQLASSYVYQIYVKQNGQNVKFPPCEIVIKITCYGCTTADIGIPISAKTWFDDDSDDESAGDDGYGFDDGDFGF